MESIQTILLQLCVVAGADVVKRACEEFLSSPGSVPLVGKKEKKPRKPRGQTTWNVFVQEVWTEMKKTNEKVKYSAAMTEAKTRRAATAASAETPAPVVVAEPVAAAAAPEKKGKKVKTPVA